MPMDYSELTKKFDAWMIKENKSLEEIRKLKKRIRKVSEMIHLGYEDLLQLIIDDYESGFGNLL